MAGHPGADWRAHHAERNTADQREKSPDHGGGARQARGAGILILYMQERKRARTFSYRISGKSKGCDSIEYQRWACVPEGLRVLRSSIFPSHSVFL